MIKIAILVLTLIISAFIYNEIFQIALILSGITILYLFYKNMKLDKKNKLEIIQINEQFQDTINKYNQLEYYQLFLFINKIKIPIILLNDFGKIIQKNEELKNIFEEIPKIIIFEIEILMGSKKSNKEIVYLNKIYSIEKHIINLQNKDLFLFFINDKTEQLKTKKMQEDFISNTSHELRNPLTTLIAATSFLKRDIKEEEKNQFVEIIETELLKMKNLVEDIFTISKLENEKFIFSEKNLKDVIEEVINKYKIFNNDINFVLELEKCLVNIDEEKIKQVLNNLLDNAIKYKATKIWIKLSENLSIFDNGIGINENDLPFVFERFYKGDQSRNPNIDSSGLGLTISKEIINMHNWDINIESVENKYTNVIISFNKEVK